MTKQTTAIFGNVSVQRLGDLLSLQVLGAEEIATIHKVVDVYLNTRPEAPKWLFDLSDTLNPVKVPARRSIPHG